jgi:hypothetical protein
MIGERLGEFVRIRRYKNQTADIGPVFRCHCGAPVQEVTTRHSPSVMYLIFNAGEHGRIHSCPATRPADAG